MFISLPFYMYSNIVAFKLLYIISNKVKNEMSKIKFDCCRMYNFHFHTHRVQACLPKVGLLILYDNFYLPCKIIDFCGKL